VYGNGGTLFQKAKNCVIIGKAIKIKMHYHSICKISYLLGEVTFEYFLSLIDGPMFNYRKEHFNIYLDPFFTSTTSFVIQTVNIQY